MEKTVLAIDPGRSKCGVALVRRGSANRIEMLWHGVVPRETLLDSLRQATAVAPYQLVIVGGGTQSQPVVQEIREAMPSVGILVVDERETTLQARERYWEHNPRRGWRRVVPATLQVPPAPVDDFVALILAERVLLNG
jgi:RNase H-fold protein (predicted Holliday junction resolvase)